MPEQPRSAEALAAENKRLREALQAWSDMEDQHANCHECDGVELPEACEVCFPFADRARLLMRSVLASGPTEAEKRVAEVIEAWRDLCGSAVAKGAVKRESPELVRALDALAALEQEPK